MRLEEQSATLRALFPPAYTDVAVFVTDLASTTVLMFLLASLFWVVDRRRTLVVISYAFAGVALIIGLKAFLGLPRPPTELFLIELDGDAYGFPSGHTFAAVIVYGGLLLAFERTRAWLLVAAVTLLVTLIGLSRVVLGVHYLGDVVAGGLLGVGYLLVMERLTRGDPQRGFAIGVVVAVPAIVVTGGVNESILALGGSIGGVLAASRLEALPALRSRLEGVVVFTAGCSVIVFLLVVESLLLSTIGFVIPVFVALYAVLVAGIILVPAVVGRLEADVLTSRTNA